MPATALSAADALTEFFTRFGAGDGDALLALFADEVDWNVPGSPAVPWTGRRAAKTEVAEFFGIAAAEVERTESFTVDRVLADGDHAVALGSFTHVIRSTGKPFSSAYALHIGLTDGLISSYHMFEDSHAAAGAFTPEGR
jgi:uncharacterized protein